MIPCINYERDCPLKVEGDLIPTMYIRQVAPAPSAFGRSDWKFYIVPAADDVPASFAEGMREILDGRAVDFDTALREPPKEE